MEEPKKVPVKTLVVNNKNVLLKNEEVVQKVLYEKLKRDFFSNETTLTLEEMLLILKHRKQKKETLKRLSSNQNLSNL